MSLLTGGSTHRVLVVLYRSVVNERGKTDKAEVGRVLVDGRLQPSTQADVERYGGAGMAVHDAMRFICKRFPGDDLSEVIGPDGVVYEVAARPKRHRSSRATSRDVVMLHAKMQPRRWQRG